MTALLWYFHELYCLNRITTTNNNNYTTWHEMLAGVIIIWRIFCFWFFFLPTLEDHNLVDQSQLSGVLADSNLAVLSYVHQSTKLTFLSIFHAIRYSLLWERDRETETETKTERERGREGGMEGGREKAQEMVYDFDMHVFLEMLHLLVQNSSCVLPGTV